MRDRRTGKLVNGAHSDDYGGKDREEMGIASYPSFVTRVNNGTFFTDKLSKNGNGKYEKTIQNNAQLANQNGATSGGVNETGIPLSNAPA